MDGAGDKTQIVDSAMALSGGPRNVLFDDSSTGKNANPLDDSSTGRSENPLDEGETLDGTGPAAPTRSPAIPPWRRRGPPARCRAVRGKGKSGPKPQVVIGEGEPENYWRRDHDRSGAHLSQPGWRLSRGRRTTRSRRPTTPRP